MPEERIAIGGKSKEEVAYELMKFYYSGVDESSRSEIRKNIEKLIDLYIICYWATQGTKEEKILKAFTTAS